MEKDQILAYGHEQLELQRRQKAAEPHIETRPSLEALCEKYAELAERIVALPSREEERIKDLEGGRGRFLDRFVFANIDTTDKDIPQLALTLHTGHYVDDDDQFEPSQSTYLEAEWIAPGHATQTGGTLVIQREGINPPNERTDVQEAARILGLIEESVVEAEQVLVAATV